MTVVPPGGMMPLHVCSWRSVFLLSPKTGPTISCSTDILPSHRLPPFTDSCPGLFALVFSIPSFSTHNSLRHETASSVNAHDFLQPTLKFELLLHPRFSFSIPPLTLIRNRLRDSPAIYNRLWFDQFISLFFLLSRFLGLLIF